MHNFLLKIFAELNEAGIVYCVLRGGDELEAGGNSGEIDLLVAPDQLPRLAKILAAQDFVALPSWGYAPHHFFVAYDRAHNAWCKFDVVTELRYGKPIRALRVDLAERCLRHRRLRSGMYVPSPEDEFITLLLHCLLDKASFREARAARLVTLRNQIAEDQIAGQRLANYVKLYLAPALTWEMLALAIDQQNWQMLASQRTAVARQLWRRDALTSLAHTISAWLLRRLRPLFFAMRRRGMMVALLAPDGAGKSTLANALAQEAPRFAGQARLIYAGTNIDAGTISLPSTRWLHKRAKSASSLAKIVFNALRFCNRLVEQWCRFAVAVYHRWRGRLVIFDRYVYDSWLVQRATTRWKRLRRWLLELGWPQPDLVILLNAPGDLLYQRKHEHTPEWLEQQRRAYLNLKDRLPQMVVVDATREANEVRQEVVALIWDQVSKKSNNKNIRWP
jgi:thymidylate kinase